MDQAEFNHIIATWKEEEILWKEQEADLLQRLGTVWTLCCPGNDAQWSTPEGIAQVRRALLNLNPTLFVSE